MKIALSWLADYLGGASLDPDTVIETCASLGLPVEDVAPRALLRARAEQPDAAPAEVAT